MKQGKCHTEHSRDSFVSEKEGESPKKRGKVFFTDIYTEENSQYEGLVDKE